MLRRIILTVYVQSMYTAIRATFGSSAPEVHGAEASRFRQIVTLVCFWVGYHVKWDPAGLSMGSRGLLRPTRFRGFPKDPAGSLGSRGSLREGSRGLICASHEIPRDPAGSHENSIQRASRGNSRGTSHRKSRGPQRSLTSTGFPMGTLGISRLRKLMYLKQEAPGSNLLGPPCTLWFPHSTARSHTKSLRSPQDLVGLHRTSRGKLRGGMGPHLGRHGFPW